MERLCPKAGYFLSELEGISFRVGQGRSFRLQGDCTPGSQGFFRHLRGSAYAVSFQRMKHEAPPAELSVHQPGTTCASVERRRAVRYLLRVPLVFRWQGSGNNHLQGDGVTRDISARGAYVLSVTAPPVGTVVHVEVYLLGFREPKSRIKARMRVSRVDDRAMDLARLGFSLAGDGFQLISQQVRGWA
jgi:hypothetical protein